MPSRTRPRPRLLFFLVALTACVSALFAGCGDGGGGEADGDGDLQTLLALAAERTGSTDTVRSRLEMRFVDVPGVPEDPTVTDLLTTVDGTRGKGIFSQFGEKYDVIIADEAYYYALPGLPGGAKWARLTFDDLKELAGIDVAALSEQSPTDGLERLRAAGDVTEIGTDDIDGVGTTHYRARVSIDTLADLDAFSDELIEQTRGLMGDSYDLDVWIDDDGYARRMTWVIDLAAAPDPPAGMPAEGEIRYEQTLSEFGAPLDVNAPPASQVVDVADLN